MQKHLPSSHQVAACKPAANQDFMRPRCVPAVTEGTLALQVLGWSSSAALMFPTDGKRQVLCALPDVH